VHVFEERTAPIMVTDGSTHIEEQAVFVIVHFGWVHFFPFPPPWWGFGGDGTVLVMITTSLFRTLPDSANSERCRAGCGCCCGRFTIGFLGSAIATPLDQKAGHFAKDGNVAGWLLRQSPAKRLCRVYKPANGAKSGKGCQRVMKTRWRTFYASSANP
jgi:hypothetical protein